MLLLNETFLVFIDREPTVINGSINNDKNSLIDANQNYLTSSSSSSSSSVNFRSMLRRTDIDPDILRNPSNNEEKPVYDFRKRLRKTGRLDFIAQEE